MRDARSGFGLAEAIVGTALFLLCAVAVYQGSIAVMRSVRLSKVMSLATALANEQFEIAHNLPYNEVGNVNGAPPGRIPASQTLTRGGLTFNVQTEVRGVDDPFDGTIGGSPNDLNPDDYRLVEVTVTCATSTCIGFKPLVLDATIAPKALEGSTGNGALFIKAFDANGLPIAGAAVHVQGTSATSSLSIDDITSTNGIFQLVDVPPSINGYHIIVTKTGYSTDQSYPLGGVGNPNPTKPDATVAADKVTQLSFAIDHLSSLNVSTVTPVCAAVPNLPFTLTGSKLIGTPNVLKYSQNKTTDGTGLLTIPSLEWDTYTFANGSASYDLAGTVPLSPFAVLPASSQNMQVILSPSTPRALMITIMDTSTQLPISGATVTISKGGFSNSLITGRGFLRQTDWSGGSGQTTVGDPTRYLSDDGNIAANAPSGDLTLTNTAGVYPLSGTLTSSTFDTGSPSNFYSFTSQPISQPPATGGDSVHFQIATNNDQTTWNFLGPDGTPWSYYTATNTNISAANNGNRYLRYQTVLATATATSTPDVSDIAFTFTSACVPPGQVLFNGLSAGTYTVDVSVPGYQDYSGTADVSANWQAASVLMQPN